MNGKERAAPDEVKDLLLQSFAKDAWDVDDILEPGHKPSAQELAYWDALVEAAAAEATVDMPSKPTMLRFKMWLMAHGDDVQDEDEAPEKSLLGEEDIAAQGAREGRVSDIVFADVSWHLGRPAGRVDLVGAEYGLPPNRSAGGHAHIKQKLPTMETELEAASKSGDLSSLQTFMMQTVDSLAGSTHPYANKASMRLNQLWLRTTRYFPNRPLAMVEYLKQYRRAKRGRFIPTLFDHELAGMASNTQTAVTPAPATSGGGGGSSSVDVGEALAKMMSKLDSVSSSVGQMRREIDDIKKNGNEKPPGGPRDKPPKRTECFICGQEGHQMADCPNIAEVAAKRAAAAEAKK